MGKIRPDHIKNAGNKIIRRYANRVSTDFQENKELLEEVTDISSKRLRNRLAGYLVGEKRKEGRIINPPKKMRKIRSKKDRKKLKKESHKWI